MIKSAVWVMLASAGATGVALALLAAALLLSLPLAWGFLRFMAASARRYFD